MGWAGLAAVLAPSPELGAGLGLVAEAAAGAEGAGVARVEEVVEDGVTAADWLRELGRAREHWRVTCLQRHHNTSILPQTLCCQVSGRSLNHAFQAGRAPEARKPLGWYQWEFCSAG